MTPSPPLRLLSPAGPGGVAVLAVVADRLGDVAGLLRPRGARFVPAGAPFPPPDRPVLADLVLDPDPAAPALDQALVVPRAEGGVEVHVHGSPAVLERLRASGWLAPPPGASSAPVALLREALSPQQIALGLEQLEVRARLLRAAGAPAGTDLAAFLRTCPRPFPAPFEDALRAALSDPVPPALAEPCIVVLTGPRNAGKSTLFNRLIGAERAVTGPEAGLTRDPVRETVALGGYPYELVDTAGGNDDAADALDRVEPTADAGRIDLDRRARARTSAEVARAGARIQLVPPSDVAPRARSGPEPPGSRPIPTLVVHSKSDLRTLPPGPRVGACDTEEVGTLRLAALDPASVADVRRLVGRELARLRRLPWPAPFRSSAEPSLGLLGGDEKAAARGD